VRIGTGVPPLKSIPARFRNAQTLFSVRTKSCAHTSTVCRENKTASSRIASGILYFITPLITFSLHSLSFGYSHVREFVRRRQKQFFPGLTKNGALPEQPPTGRPHFPG